MTPEQAHDAAWADFELSSASDALRSAVERAVRALTSVSRAGGHIDADRHIALGLLREAEERIRAIPYSLTAPPTLVGSDTAPWGVG